MQTRSQTIRKFNFSSPRNTLTPLYKEYSREQQIMVLLPRWSLQGDLITWTIMVDLHRIVHVYKRIMLLIYTGVPNLILSQGTLQRYDGISFN